MLRKRTLFSHISFVSRSICARGPSIVRISFNIYQIPAPRSKTQSGPGADTGPRQCCSQLRLRRRSTGCRQRGVNLSRPGETGCSAPDALVRLRTPLPGRENVQPSLPVLGLLKAATPAATAAAAAGPAASFLSDSCCSSRSSWTALALSASFRTDSGSGFVVFFTVFSFFWSFAACAGLKSSWAGSQVQSRSCSVESHVPPKDCSASTFATDYQALSGPCGIKGFRHAGCPAAAHNARCLVQFAVWRRWPRPCSRTLSVGVLMRKCSERVYRRIP